MIAKDQIPEMALCPKCGQPMKVIDLNKQAERLGVGVAPGSYVIECCGSELTIEDESEARNLRELLIAYHGGAE